MGGVFVGDEVTALYLLFVVECPDFFCIYQARATKNRETVRTQLDARLSSQFCRLQDVGNGLHNNIIA